MCLNRCVALYFYAPTFHHVAKLSNKFNLSKQNLKNAKIYFKFQSVEIILGVDGSVIRVFGVIYWRDSLQAVRMILQVCGRI